MTVSPETLVWRGDALVVMAEAAGTRGLDRAATIGGLDCGKLWAVIPGP